MCISREMGRTSASAEQCVEELQSSSNRDTETREETAAEENPPREHSPLEEMLQRNGEARGGADTDHRSLSSNPSARKNLICVSGIAVGEFIIIIILIGTVVVLRVEKSDVPPVEQRVGGVAACPSDDWVTFEGKCYYFSEAEGTWTHSSSNCSALNTSLAEIDTQKEKDFMLRYKGFRDHWIGLRRERGSPWRRMNGTEFSNWFHIGGGGECAYLKETTAVSPSRCSLERHWICRNPQMWG